MLIDRSTELEKEKEEEEMGGGSMKSNPTRGRKRVEAATEESTEPCLVRGKDGSAFARWYPSFPLVILSRVY